MIFRDTGSATSEPGKEPAANVVRSLSLGQQRVLELMDGQSFLLRTLSIVEGGHVVTPWRYRTASEIADRLSRWALGQHVLITHRRIDPRTVRIWRVSAI